MRDAKGRVAQHAAHMATLAKISEVHAVSRKPHGNLEDGLRLLMHQRDYQSGSSRTSRNVALDPPFQICKADRMPLTKVVAQAEHRGESLHPANLGAGAGFLNYWRSGMLGNTS